jgi:hypothetical protein
MKNWYKSRLTRTKLQRWESRVPNGKQKFVTITKITVPTEYDKQQLLTAFEYIHDLHCIDSDYHAVNTVMHMYRCPFLIEVKSTRGRWYDDKKLVKAYNDYNGENI